MVDLIKRIENKIKELDLKIVNAIEILIFSILYL